MGEKRRVVVIGLDAADRDLILKWGGEGKLPVLQRLLSSRASGAIDNPDGLYVGAVWPSFYTGVSPAKHSRYCFVQLRPGSYEVKPFHPREVQATPFWDAFSDQGKRVAVIDVPKTYASKTINGVHIVDWGTHDPEDGLRTTPPELAASLSGSYGIDEIQHCNAFRTKADEFAAFRDALLERIERKVEMARAFLRREPWDCFVSVFSESHCVGHQCWHLHDTAHPKHDPRIREAIGDPIEQVYIALDAAVGKLIEEVGEDTTVLLVASHGMGPHYDATFMLDAILRRLEDGPVPPRPPTQRGMFRLWSLLPETWRKPLKFLTAPIKQKVQPPDWRLRRRRYFQIPNNDVYGGIRINMVGREPHGTVEPGADYEACCAQLTRDLLALVNADTGKPLVERVIKTDDLYSGRCREWLPDLMVEWDRSTPVARVSSAKTGLVEGTYRKCRTGDHTKAGLFVAAGPGIGHAELGEVSIMDFAPTLAEILDADLPDADGRSFAQVLLGPIDAARPSECVARAPKA